MADLPQIYLTQNDMESLFKLVDAQPGKRLRSWKANWCARKSCRVKRSRKTW